MSVLHTGLAPLEIAMRLQLKVPARSQALQDMHGQELSRPAIGLHDVLEMQEGRSHDDYERGPGWRRVLWISNCLSCCCSPIDQRNAVRLATFVLRDRGVDVFKTSMLNST